MTSRWLFPAVAGLALVAGSAQAQGSVSIIPMASYVTSGGDWIKPTAVNGLAGPTPGTFTYGLKPGGGISVGVIAELSMSKSLSLAAQVGRTLGGMQTLEENYFSSGASGTGNVFTVDMATTNLGAMLVFRPLGRTPSGAPKTLYLELGGGVNIYNVSQGFTSAGATNTDVFSYDYSTPALMAGLGFSFPVGRRVSLQLFGRGYYQLSEYDAGVLASSGDVNQTSLTQISSAQGEKTMLFQFGAGLMVGR